MEPFNFILRCLGDFVFLLSLASACLENVPFPATLASLFIGVALGPAVLDVIDVSALQTQPPLMENLGRITLAISLAGVALRIPRRFIVRKWRQTGEARGSPDLACHEPDHLRIRRSPRRQRRATDCLVRKLAQNDRTVAAYCPAPRTLAFP